MSLDRFKDWRDRADQCDLLETAKRYGAVMKRNGREFKGPCCMCGGKDRFSLSTLRHRWYCRGGQCGGNGAISMVMHIAGLSFLQACEALTGEPNPSGRQAKPLSEAEKAAINRRRLENEAIQRAREAQQMQKEEDSREYCAKILSECQPIAGTLAEKYLHLFHLPTPPMGWPDCLLFHPALQYPGKGKMPALVARVDDVSGQMTGIWREFIRADGRKADVELQKLGLGPVAGGAVRLGGVAPHIGAAEGVRTALGAWALIGFKYPVWSCLSTAGLTGFEVPLGVDKITGFPDGDAPIKKHGDEFSPAVPAGRKAMIAMRDRVTKEGVGFTLAAEPKSGADYLDLWHAVQR